MTKLLRPHDVVSGWENLSSRALSDLGDLFVSTAFAATDPLVLDLDKDGIETTKVTNGASSDHNGDGFAEKTGWASQDDGLLVMDRNGDSIIYNGKELFGDQTILNNGAKAANGFAALAEWDENKDGKINSTDAVWSQLKIWQDVDGDGYSAPDELSTLDEQGISTWRRIFTLHVTPFESAP